jgi:hypothetical protein
MVWGGIGVLNSRDPQVEAPLEAFDDARVFREQAQSRELRLPSAVRVRGRCFKPFELEGMFGRHGSSFRNRSNGVVRSGSWAGSRLVVASRSIREARLG